MRQSGRRSRLAAAFFLLAAISPELVSASETRSGTIEILTADDFEGGRSERLVLLTPRRGRPVELILPEGQSDIATGARVSVRGEPDADRFRVETLELLEAAPLAEAPGISGNSTVLTILLKFNDTVTEPYTVAQMQNRMFGAGGVAAYFAEASYGNHTLSGVVTTWLTATVPTPTTCDYITVSQQADARATDAGYNPYTYQKRVYVFPHIPCGWLGLGGGGVGLDQPGGLQPRRRARARALFRRWTFELARLRRWSPRHGLLDQRVRRPGSRSWATPTPATFRRT